MVGIAGKTVLITGASRGIGADSAKIFAQAGANVVLMARSGAAINELAQEIGSNARAIPCDVSKFDDFEKAVAFANNEFGPVDVLIGNAGVVEPISHLATSDPAAWGNTIDINLKGIYYGARAVLPSMLDRDSGTIINISSGAAHGAVEAWSHYCASKAGAAMVTKAIHKEYGDKGIRVMGLSPGTVATQMQKEIKASGINPVAKLDWSDHIPAEWPARTCLWMCSDEANGFLGQEISLRDDNIRRAVGLIE